MFQLRRFMGSFGSTFSAYIYRLRAYHSLALVPDKGVYFVNYPDTKVPSATPQTLTVTSDPDLPLDYNRALCLRAFGKQQRR